MLTWRLKSEYHLMISYLDDINHEIYIDEDGQYPLKYYEISGTSNDEIPDKIIFIENYDDLELPTKTNFFLNEHKSSYSGNFWKDVEKRLIAKVYINNSYLLDK